MPQGPSLPGQPGQSNPPSQAPAGATPQGPSPEMAIKSIQQGFQALGQMIQKAGPNLPPEDVKLFATAMKATDDLIQSLSGPAGNQASPAPRSPGGPMAANANAGAQYAGPQGR